jgi:hypothetical protein
VLLTCSLCARCLLIRQPPQDYSIFILASLTRTLGQDKRERAIRQAARLVRQLRQQAGAPATESLEEKEARLQHLQDFNAKVCVCVCVCVC